MSLRLLIVMILATLVLPRTAAAERGRLRTDAVAVLGQPPLLRVTEPGVGVGLGLGWDEFFEGRVRGLFHRPDAIEATVGLAGRLDILRWVPVAEVSLGWATVGAVHSPIVRFELGTDWLLNRQWYLLARGSVRAGFAEELRGVSMMGVFGFGRAWGF